MASIFARVPADERAPPPPSWLAEFATQSAGGVCGGLAWGGYRGLVAARATGVSSRPGEVAAVHFVRGALAGALRVGGFVALFSAAALGAEYARGARDPANYALAGGATAGAFALRAMPPAAAARPAAAAAAAAGALGAAQTALERRAGGKLFDVVHAAHPADEHDPVPVQAVVDAIADDLATRTRARVELSARSAPEWTPPSGIGGAAPE